MRRQIAIGAMLLGLAAIAVAVDSLAGDPERPHTVVFVVLDTVRAQNTSLCGYDRPTTPVLQGLVQQGASFSCRAYAPSSWTLPSHASYFTGVDIAAHGAGATLGELRLFGSRAQPLREDLPTLAERFAARGYTTALVAANPLVGPRTGLSRGFEQVRTARRWAELRGDHLPAAVEQVLDQVKPDQRLFLTVNILDAHNDWPEVPEGHDWLPPRDRLPMNPTRERYEAMEDGPERRALAAHLRDVYDQALTVADHNLGAVLQALKAHGRLDASFRLVVTADHGEYLGEHGRMAHGGTELFEEVTRVPLVVHDSARRIPLPEMVSALVVHDLLLDGELAKPGGRAFSGKLSNGRADATGVPCATTGVAFWRGTEKLRCQHGVLERFDLARDPGEAAPKPLGRHPGRRALLDYARRIEATNQGRSSEHTQLAEQLEALGYVE